MPATANQFQQEAGRLLKGLYTLHRDSRASYKSAVERLSVLKMPSATEFERHKFVQFGLRCFDLMRASGFEPDTPMSEVIATDADKPRPGSVLNQKQCREATKRS